MNTKSTILTLIPPAYYLLHNTTPQWPTCMNHKQTLSLQVSAT